MAYSCCDLDYKSRPKRSVVFVVDSLEPVSYTHLDVYKRQQLVCAQVFLI